MSSYQWPPSGAGGVTSLNSLVGALTLVAGSNVTITPSGQNLIIAASGGGGSGVSTIGTYDAGTPSSDALFISGTTLFAQSASATNPGMVNTSTQTLKGAKTLSDTLTITNAAFISASQNVNVWGGPLPGLFIDSSQHGTLSDVLVLGSTDTSNASISTTGLYIIGGDNTAVGASADTGPVLIGSGSVTDTSSIANTGSFTIGTGSPSGSGSSGAAQIGTGFTNSGASGGLQLLTGSSTSGNSGNITIATGTSTATRGKIQLQDGSQGTSGQVWTSTDVSGSGHWAPASGGGSGTVTSVAMTTPAFLSVSGSPITASGTLGLTLSGTALPTANGGTGLTSPGAAGNILTSNGSIWTTSSLSASSAFASYASSIINTLSSSTSSTTFVTFSNSPSFTITPTISGTYKIYCSAPLYEITTGRVGNGRVFNTSGGAVLLQESQSGVYNNAGQMISSGLTQSVYTLTAGTTYVFDIQGKVDTGAGVLQLDGGDAPFYMFAEGIALNGNFNTAITPWSTSLSVTPSAGFGTVTSSVIPSRVVGDTLEVQGSFLNGTVAASLAYIQLPAGYAIDYTKINTAVTSKVGEYVDYTGGDAYIYNDSATPSGVLFVDGSTTDKVYFAYQVVSNAISKVNGNVAWVTGRFVSFDFKVPIVGLTVSSIAPPPSMRYYSSSTTISGSLATINYATQDYDTNSAYSAGTYTIPLAGKYQINASLLITGTVALNNTLIMEIQKNGSVVSRKTLFLPASITDGPVQCNDIINCALNDTIRIQVSTSTTLPSIVSSNFDNFLSIAKVA